MSIPMSTSGECPKGQDVSTSPVPSGPKEPVIPSRVWKRLARWASTMRCGELRVLIEDGKYAGVVRVERDMRVVNEGH